MSISNCGFLTCIQISQEVRQVVWYSHLFQNFPQYTVIHIVKGFGTVNKAEIDVFLELLLFRYGCICDHIVYTVLYLLTLAYNNFVCNQCLILQ